MEQDESYKAVLEEIFGPVYWIQDVPWLVRNRILSPLHLPHTLPEFSSSEIIKGLDDSGALLAWWVDQWDEAGRGFHWVCCDIDNYSEKAVRNSRYRKLVRKGNKLGTLRRVDPRQIAKQIYYIYKKASSENGATGGNIESEVSFCLGLEIKAKSEMHEFWVMQVEERIVAYCECLLINGAVRLISGKLDQDYRKLNPNNALFFGLTQHYLTERKKSYVTNGQKTIHHPSNVNTLFENLGYRKVYCRPRIAYSAKLSPLASVLSTKIGASVLSSIPLPSDIKSKLEGLMQVIELQKEYK